MSTLQQTRVRRVPARTATDTRGTMRDLLFRLGLNQYARWMRWLVFFCVIAFMQMGVESDGNFLLILWGFIIFMEVNAQSLKTYFTFQFTQKQYFKDYWLMGFLGLILLGVIVGINALVVEGDDRIAMILVNAGIGVLSWFGACGAVAIRELYRAGAGFGEAVSGVFFNAAFDNRNGAITSVEDERGTTMSSESALLQESLGGQTTAHRSANPDEQHNLTWVFLPSHKIWLWLVLIMVVGWVAVLALPLPIVPALTLIVITGFLASELAEMNRNAHAFAVPTPIMMRSTLLLTFWQSLWMSAGIFVQAIVVTAVARLEPSPNGGVFLRGHSRDAVVHASGQVFRDNYESLGLYLFTTFLLIGISLLAFLRGGRGQSLAMGCVVLVMGFVLNYVQSPFRSTPILDDSAFMDARIAAMGIAVVAVAVVLLRSSVEPGRSSVGLVRR